MYTLFPSIFKSKRAALIECPGGGGGGGGGGLKQSDTIDPRRV